MNEIRRFLTTAATAASLIAAHDAPAQTHVVAPPPGQGVWLEVARPHFKSLELTLPTSVWFLAGRVPLSQRLRITVDVPVAYAGFDDDANFGSQTSTVLGNPLVGVEYAVTPRLAIELGARAPLTTADVNSVADFIGFLGEPQRGEAFLQDAVPVLGAVTLEQPVTSALSVRARAAVTSAIYTGDDDDEETSTFADYGLFGNYSFSIARFGAGVSGRWVASADAGSFSDNSLHQLSLTADAPIGGVRPGLSLRVPLDKTHRDIVDFNIGAYIQVPLN